MIRTGTAPELENFKPYRTGTGVHTLRVPGTVPWSDLPGTKELLQNRCSALL
ncbi:MAG: hypothetical protein GY702_10260 [Desulfobulbaceae bacterium]|nr:hypothetical protein [Desulfobulbaceae bacterium]